MKSWLLLDLALQVAAGKPWLGQFQGSQRHSVLYMDEEMSAYELRRRVKALARGAGIESEDLPLRIISHSDTRFDRRETVEAVLADLRIQSFDPTVIIVETLRRVLNGSENDAEAVSAFWRSVSPILDARKALIVSHHMRKPQQGGNDARHRASGSTDILAGADLAFAVDRTEDCLTLECVKSRTAKESDIFRVRFEDQGQEGRIRMRFDGYVEDRNSTCTSSQRVGAFICDFLTMEGGQSRTGRIEQWLFEHHQVTQSQTEKALQFLKKAGRIEHPSHGLWKLRVFVDPVAA